MLQRLAVKSEFRRLGVAKKLMTICEDHIKETALQLKDQHPPDLILSTYTYMKAANCFYKKMKYLIVGCLNVPIKYCTGVVVDNVLIKRFRDM